MSDIVERLRGHDERGGGEGSSIFAEAADEVERLRAALADMIIISQRNSEATLMLIAIRKCAEHALKEK